MPAVSRASRLFDIAALLSILAGILMYFTAAGKLREISTLSYRNPGPRNQSALAAADSARYLSYAAVAIVLTGIAIGAAGAIRHRQAHRTQ